MSALPKSPVVLGTATIQGVRRSQGTAENWRNQLKRAVLDTCRMCCPEEYALMSQIPVTDVATWLSLMCKFYLERNIIYAPSPEEISIMINSQEFWADTVAYETDKVRFLVISDSTLIWSKRSRGPYLKSCRDTASFLIQGGAKAQDFVNMLKDHQDKSTPIILLWNLNDLVVDSGHTWKTLPEFPAGFHNNVRELAKELKNFRRAMAVVGGFAEIWGLDDRFDVHIRNARRMRAQESVVSTTGALSSGQHK